VTTTVAAEAFLIVLPLAFNGFLLLLGRRFDYPDILRRPAEDILNRFQAGGVGLKLVWYGFMLTAVLFAPLAVLLGQVLAGDEIAVIPTAIVVGVLAAVVQFLGLARWPFLVPALARAYTDPASTSASREATKVVFDSFHRYLGVGIGECLGYLLTGAWSVLIGVAMIQSRLFEAWLAWPGSSSAYSWSSARSSSSDASRSKAGSSRARSSRSATSPGRYGSSLRDSYSCSSRQRQCGCA